MFLNSKKIAIISIVGWLFLIGILYGSASKEVSFDADLVEMNHIYQEVIHNWDHLTVLSGKNFKYEFSVADGNKKILYKTTNASENMKSIENAIREHQAYYVIKMQDKQVGTLIIESNYIERLQQDKTKMVSIVAGISTVMLVFLNFLLLYLKKNMIQPFERMKETAQQIAAGNLDIPLKMDKNHVCGAFTESFDILREELKIAREKEYQANQSKKELVASLSHDIKTPVTSIKLISEVMIAKYPGGETEQKFLSINQKAEQIDALISNMFHVTMEELGELEVICTDEDSDIIKEIVTNADYNEKINCVQEVESCLISVDKLRLEQVIGNIINNSYKYADTPIQVTCAIKNKYLRLQIKDFGPGVKEEELPLIFQKYYRSNMEHIRKQSGTGLGLYICSYLMDKMGGSIRGMNDKDGFVIEVLIALSE